MLFQDGALFGSMTLFDNVAFPLRQHTEKGEEEIAEIVNRRLTEVGLGDANEKMPNELSGGMRKRAGFARALVMEPDIVLFDEPDSGLDPVRTALLCELIQEVHAENGGCYVVITHDIMSARRVAEHISVLWKGRIVESGPAAGAVRLRKPVRAAVPLRRVRRAARHGVAPPGVPGARGELPMRTLRGCSRRSRRRRGPAPARWCSRWPPRSGSAARVLALRLQPSAATSSFVSSSSAPYQATQTFYRQFGEEPVEVLVQGDLQQLVLELGPRPPARPGGLPLGQRPALGARHEGGVDGPCGRLARRAHGQGGLRARHVPQRGRQPDPGQARRG